MTTRQQIEVDQDLIIGAQPTFLPQTKLVKRWTAVPSSSSPNYGGETLFTIAAKSMDFLSDCVIGFNVAASTFSAGTAFLRMGALSFVDSIEVRTSNSSVLVRYSRDVLYALSRRLLNQAEMGKFDAAIGLASTDPTTSKTYFIPLNFLPWSKHTNYSGSLAVGALSSDLIVSLVFRNSANILDGGATLTAMGAISNTILYLEGVKAPAALQDFKDTLAAHGKISRLMDDFVECPSQTIASGSTACDVEIGGVPGAHLKWVMFGVRQAADLTTPGAIDPVSWQSFSSFSIGDGQGNSLGSSFQVPQLFQLSVSDDDLPNDYNSSTVLSLMSFSLQPDQKSSQTNQSSGGIRLSQSPRLIASFSSTGQINTVFLLAAIHSVLVISADGSISKSSL